MHTAEENGGRRVKKKKEKEKSDGRDAAAGYPLSGTWAARELFPARRARAASRDLLCMTPAAGVCEVFSHARGWMDGICGDDFFPTPQERHRT